MRRLRALSRRIAGLFRKRGTEREMEEELASHFDLHVADNVRAGMSPAEARRQAFLKFGGVVDAKERYRDRASLPFFDSLQQDIRYGLRQLARNPGFTATAVLLLALGIGANAAIFSFLDAMLLRSLPVRDPGSLVHFKWHVKGRAAVAKGISGESHQDPELGYVSGSLPYPFFETLEKQRAGSSLSNVFGFAGGGVLTFNAGAGAETARSLFVSGDFFQGLGVVPAGGRLIAPADDTPAAPIVAVVGYEYWQAQLGGTPDLVGKNVLINGKPATVIGITPPAFFGVNPINNVQVYLPIRHFEEMFTTFIANSESRYVGNYYYWTEIMGRLKPGVSRRQAEAEFASAFHSWVSATANTEQERKTLPKLFLLDGSGGLDRLRTYYLKPVFVLMGMAGLILAIACANVANLLLARASTRRREIAIRQGLGANRWRVVRQLLTESLLLGLLGGLAGVMLAWPGMRGLIYLMATWLPTTDFRAEWNWNVVALAAALAITTGILFGLAPALTSSGRQLTDGLKESRIGGSDSLWSNLLGRRLGRGLLVVLQIALSLVLVSGAALFVKTLVNLQQVNLGFNQENLLLFEANARQAGYTDQTLPNFFNQVLSNLQGAPGVKSVSLVSDAPFSGRSGTRITVPGSTLPPPRFGTAVNWVGAGILATLQIPLIGGRDLDDRDTANSPRVAVINEAFASTYYPGENPLGRSIVVGSPENQVATIVGVAKNSSIFSLQEAAEPLVIAPFSQYPKRIDRMTFIVRTAGDPLAAVTLARDAVRAVDQNVPLQQIRTQQAQVQQTIGQQRLFATLGSAFAGLALWIAVIGLYGTIVYEVGRRTGELGVRIALGARRAGIIRLVMKDAFAILVAGLLLGLPAVYFTSRFVESFLFNVKPQDPRMLITAIAVLTVAALVSAWLPARRASLIDPMTALRHE